MALAIGMNPPNCCLPSRDLRASPCPTYTVVFDDIPEGLIPCGIPAAQGWEETPLSPKLPKSPAGTTKAEGQEVPLLAQGREETTTSPTGEEPLPPRPAKSPAGMAEVEGRAVPLLPNFEKAP